jgi:uncharacterized protein YacL
MALLILRACFLVVVGGMAVTVFDSAVLPDTPSWLPLAVFGGAMLLAAGIIALDVALKQKRIDTISSVYFGLLIGLLLTYVVGIALTPLLDSVLQSLNEEYRTNVRSLIQLFLGAILSYTCISFLLQTKDDFRFVIPYVEFARDVKGLRPYLLDTSAIIDGRIADVLETHVWDNQLIMPRFVLAEIQGIADSGDKLRRSRGRRGLDILNRLRSNTDIDFQISDRELPEMEGQDVDMKLVLLAKHLAGKLITGDYNLSKVARLQNVPVVNLNDLSNALKPVFLPGEHVAVRIVKPGEEDGQGVGYLDDGTMIVVEGGRPHIGREVRIAVTSVLQTSAGRMIFGKFEELAEKAR